MENFISSWSIEPPSKGHPSRSQSSSSSIENRTRRLPRSTCVSQIKSWVFQCSKASSGQGQRAETDAMGRRFMVIKSRSQSEMVKVILTNLNEPSVCSTLDLLYHKNCLREHERKIQVSANSPDEMIWNTTKYITSIDIIRAV